MWFGEPALIKISPTCKQQKNRYYNFGRFEEVLEHVCRYKGVEEMIKILTSLIIIESLVITSFFVTPHTIYQVITNINWIAILISICVLASTIAVLTGIVYLLLNK